MAVANPMRKAREPDDFTARLSQQIRRAIGSADRGMVVQPYADPGYAMPNVDVGNLNQMPGQEVSGWLPSAAQGSGLLNLSDEQLANLLGLST